MIHIGNTENGKEIRIPIHHTGCFGQTGVGKTRLLKHMLRQAIDYDFRVLIIDSKLTHPEFAGIGQDIPLYLEESTDPDIFRSLIEQVRPKGKGNMERYRGGFIELCHPADEEPSENFSHIGARLAQKLKDPKVKGYTRTMYAEIQHDFLRLKDLLGKYQFARRPELDIPGPIARMATRELPNVALQGLVLRSVIEEILRRGETRLIVLIDEAPNFCHQKYYNPAKEAIQQLDAQGRSNELFGWYSGQTLSGFDKSNMKNLWYWVMGREMEINEAKAVHATQTSTILSMQQIRKLKVREFLVATPEDTYLVTVPDVPADKALFAEIPIPRTRRKADPVIDAPRVATEEDVLVEKLVQANAKLAEVETERDQLLTTNNELHTRIEEHQQEITLLTNVTKAFAGLRDYIDQRIKDMAPGGLRAPGAAGDISVDSEDVQVQVSEKTRMEKLDESKLEGMLVILMADRIWTTAASQGKLEKMITDQWGKIWGGGGRKALKAALQKLSLRPFLLVKYNADHSWAPTDKGKAITKEAA